MSVICLNCDGWGAWTEMLKRYLALESERDRLLAELALLRVPGGAA